MPTRQAGARGPVNYTGVRIGTGTPAWMGKTAAAAKGQARNNRAAEESSDEENVDPVESKAPKHNNSKDKAPAGKSSKANRKPKHSDDEHQSDSDGGKQPAAKKRGQRKAAAPPSPPSKDDSSQQPAPKQAANKRKSSSQGSQPESHDAEEPSKKAKHGSSGADDDKGKSVGGPSRGTIVSMKELQEQERQQKLEKPQQQAQPRARSKPSKKGAATEAAADPAATAAAEPPAVDAPPSSDAAPPEQATTAPVPIAKPAARSKTAAAAAAAGPAAVPPPPPVAGAGAGGSQGAAAAELQQQVVVSAEEAELLRPLDVRPTASAAGTQAFIMLQRQFTQLQSLYTQLKAQKINQLEGLLEEQDEYIQSRLHAMDLQAAHVQRVAQEGAQKVAQAEATLQQLAAAQDEVNQLKRQKLALEERVVQLQADLSHLQTLRAADQEQLTAARQQLAAAQAAGAVVGAAAGGVVGVPGTVGTVMEPPLTQPGAAAAQLALGTSNGASGAGPGGSAVAQVASGAQSGEVMSVDGYTLVPGGGQAAAGYVNVQCPTPAAVSTGIGCQFPTPAASLQTDSQPGGVQEAGVACQFPTPAPKQPAAAEQTTGKKSSRLQAKQAKVGTPDARATQVDVSKVSKAVDAAAVALLDSARRPGPGTRGAARQAGKRTPVTAGVVNAGRQTLDTLDTSQQPVNEAPGSLVQDAGVVVGMRQGGGDDEHVSGSVIATMPSPSQIRSYGSFQVQLAAAGGAAAVDGASCNLTNASGAPEAQLGATASAPTPAPAPADVDVPAAAAAEVGGFSVKAKLFQTPDAHLVPVPRVGGEAGGEAVADNDDSPVEGLRTMQPEAGQAAAAAIPGAAIPGAVVPAAQQQAGQGLAMGVVKTVAIPPPHIRRKEPFPMLAPAPAPAPGQQPGGGVHLDSTGSFVVDLNPLSARKRPQTDQVTPAVGVGKEGGVAVPSRIATASTPSLVLADTPAGPVAGGAPGGGVQEGAAGLRAAHTPPLPSMHMVLAAVAPGRAADGYPGGIAAPAAAPHMTSAHPTSAAEIATGPAHAAQRNSDTSLTVMGPLQLPDLLQRALGAGSTVMAAAVPLPPIFQSPPGSHQGSCTAASHHDGRFPVPATWQLPQQGAPGLTGPAGLSQALQLLQPGDAGVISPGPGAAHAPERLSGPSVMTPRHMRQGMTKLTGLEQSYNKADGTYQYHHVATGFTFKIRDVVTGGDGLPSSASSPLSVRVVVTDTDLVDLVGPGARMVEYQPLQLGTAAGLLPEYLEHEMEMEQEQVPNMLAVLVQHLNRAMPARPKAAQ